MNRKPARTITRRTVVQQFAFQPSRAAEFLVGGAPGRLHAAAVRNSKMPK